MTVIAVKDGVIACDSLVTTEDGHINGTVKKCAPVEGGGFVATGGNLVAAQKLLRAIQQDGCRVSGEYDATALWLRQDGSCLRYVDGWVGFESEYAAMGSGKLVAIGAMEAGASAEEAVKIACRVMNCCGGEVHTYSVNA